MADEDTSNPATEIRERINRVLKSHLSDTPDSVLVDTAREIVSTRIIPLWYSPLLFCGAPGTPEVFPANDAPSAHKFSRCLVRWSDLIGRAVVIGELLAREPDGWSILDLGEPVTPDSLIDWCELEQWAMDRHGLSAGYPLMDEAECVFSDQTPDRANDREPEQSDWRNDQKLMRGEKQERAVIESIKAKGWDPQAVPDGEKGTLEMVCNAEFHELFNQTSFRETWKRGLSKQLWRMQSHASYAKRGKG